jgi:hypothetical protein
MPYKLSNVMQWSLCLRSWQKSDALNLDQRLLRHVPPVTDDLAVQTVQSDDDDDNDDLLEAEVLLYHEQGLEPEY